MFGIAWCLTLGLLEAELEMRIHIQVIYDLFSKSSQEKPAGDEGSQTGKGKR